MKKQERHLKPISSHVVESAKIRGRYFSKGDYISVTFNRYGEPARRVSLSYGRIHQMQIDTYQDKSSKVNVIAQDLAQPTFGGADAEMFEDSHILRIRKLK